MRLTRRSSLSDVALVVGAALRRHGISAVLTGGACAAVHSDGQYLSRDVDFVVQGRVTQKTLDEAMREVDFVRQGDRFIHPHTPFYVEFPPGPLAIGGDDAVTPVTIVSQHGPSLALSPTDACRDRLAAFYHWGDRQSLAVAVLIATRHRVNLATIRRWSLAEGHLEKFDEFRSAIRSNRVKSSETSRLRRNAGKGR